MVGLQVCLHHFQGLQRLLSLHHLHLQIWGKAMHVCQNVTLESCRALVSLSEELYFHWSVQNLLIYVEGAKSVLGMLAF